MGNLFNKQQKRSSENETPRRGFHLHAFPSFGVPVNTTSTSDHASKYTQRLRALYQAIDSMVPMEKTTMSGRCLPETARMERFMQTQALMANIPGEEFVQGVKAFRLTTPLADRPVSTPLRFSDENAPSTDNDEWHATIGEVLSWQATYHAFAMESALDKTLSSGSDSEGVAAHTVESRLALLGRFVRGQVQAGAEAFAMKFVVRVCQTPILCTFNGKPIPRHPCNNTQTSATSDGEIVPSHPPSPKAASAASPAGPIWLASVCGVDLAGRKHDVDDVKAYITNWREVYSLHPDTGEIYAHMGRDFVFTGVTPQLNEKLLLADLQRMLWLRLLALDYLGVQVVVETGLGLGVFAGDKIGVGARVRALSARALRLVLEEEGQLRHGVKADENARPSSWHWCKRAFRNIQCIILALPLFGPLFTRSNYHFFKEEFSRRAANTGCPVWVVDNDMHAIALTCAGHGFSVSELNPADSHGVFGEYWQNRGPGTEEKLALTTLGLLTQHHACNPYVTDVARHHVIKM